MGCRRRRSRHTLIHSDQGTQYGSDALAEFLLGQPPPAEHEPPRQLLGQRRRGILLQQPEEGVKRPRLSNTPEPKVEDAVLTQRMSELAAERRRFGYRRLHALLRREGVEANHKRIHRLYQAAGLAVRRRRQRHGVAVDREPLLLPSGPNQIWSMDFVFDALASGRRIKCLTIVDDFTKEAVGVAVDQSIGGLYVRTTTGLPAWPTPEPSSVTGVGTTTSIDRTMHWHTKHRPKSPHSIDNGRRHQ